MENDQEIIMEDIITEDIITEETPAEDMELRQDGNSENTTSFGTHTTVPLVREQLASQAEEEALAFQEVKSSRNR